MAFFKFKKILISILNICQTVWPKGSKLVPTCRASWGVPPKKNLAPPLLQILSGFFFNDYYLPNGLNHKVETGNSVSSGRISTLWGYPPHPDAFTPSPWDFGPTPPRPTQIFLPPPPQKVFLGGGLAPPKRWPPTGSTRGYQSRPYGSNCLEDIKDWNKKLRLWPPTTLGGGGATNFWGVTLMVRYMSR